MNFHELVKKNNEWRKQLTPENEKYYEDMTTYIRLSNIPGEKAEEFLQEVLDHLLQAQNEGKTAVEVFGDDPVEWLDEVTRGMRKNGWGVHVGILGLNFFVILGFIFIYSGLSGVLYPDLPPQYRVFQIEDAFFYPFVGAIGTEIYLYLSRKRTFLEKKKRKHRNQMIVLNLLYLAVGIGYKYLIQGYSLDIPLNNGISIGIGGGLLLIVTVAVAISLRKGRGYREGKAQ